MQNKNKTIIAQSSAAGRGAIALIRMSGADSTTILKSMFKSKSTLEDRKTIYGEISAAGLKDKVNAVIFLAPKSYTGEDMAEISCHANAVIVAAILEEAIGRGARLAEKGEFTMRAFVNGKLDLTQAEGIADLIDAPSPSAVKAAYALTDGRLFKKFEELRVRLIELIANIDVTIDYPEEYGQAADSAELIEKTLKLREETRTLKESYSDGKKAGEGVSVAIVGEPNAGKSTLMNALLGYDRAIVTSEAGTTRDTVEGSYIYEGIQFKLIDTAGIREPQCEAERQGIERSKKAANSADIVVTLSDNMEGLRIYNKADVIDYAAVDGLKLSAKTGEGVDELKKKLYGLSGEIDFDKLMLSNVRQYEACALAEEDLTRALETLEKGEAAELAAVDLMNACDCICSVTGVKAIKETVDSIFARFCVGK